MYAVLGVVAAAEPICTTQPRDADSSKSHPIHRHLHNHDHQWSEWREEEEGRRRWSRSGGLGVTAQKDAEKDRSVGEAKFERRGEQ